MISLINALYFNGKWDRKFNKDLTDVQSFYGRDRETKVSMMHMTGTLAVSKDDDFTAVELPMGNNRMRLYLPEEGVKVSDLVSRLSYAKIDNLSWEKANVELALPKFRADNSFEVSDIFQQPDLPHLPEVSFWKKWCCVLIDLSCMRSKIPPQARSL